MVEGNYADGTKFGGMNTLTLATDYERVFYNRLVVITGISRSGTSILGKIIGSLENVVYLFEPAIMRLLPPLAVNSSIDIDLVSKVLEGILFEDYYLQSIQGRNLNIKKSENSFTGNYQQMKAIREKWSKYERRNDALNDVYVGKFIFALKISELHPLLPILEKIFKGIKVIHIIRNGNAVISSSLKRGWYSDEYLNCYMTELMRQGKPKVPLFVPIEDVEKFCRWNRETRVAYIWRILGKMAMDFGLGNNNYLELRYEDLIKDPKKVATSCEKLLGSQQTDLTMKHIFAIQNHTVSQHEDHSGSIAAEERPFFEEFMKELDYL